MSTNVTIFNSLRAASTRAWAIAAISLSAVLGAQAATDGSAKADSQVTEQKEAKVMVVVNDRFAPADFDSERIREDLLRSAFYEAARRSKLIDEYDFEYNPVGKDAPSGSIEFDVISWRRSPTGMYSFTANASYWNADGEKVSLGNVNGMRTSIAVFNSWDVGDQFSGSAKDAFRSALRKLEKKVSEA